MGARTRRIILLLALASLSGHAHANVGVPALTHTVGPIVLWLIPIVILETLILKNQIGISRGAAAGSVTIANIASTLAGVGLMFLEILAEDTFLPYHIAGETKGYLVTFALFVPLFLLSVVIELPVVRFLNKAVDKASLKRAVIFANVGSYLMMSTFVIARMIKSAIVLS